MKDETSTGIFRTASRIALVLGAAGSVALTLQAGHGKRSILMILFIGWVGLPFAGLGLADLLSSGWSASARRTLRYLIWIVAAASLIIYGYVVTHPRPQQAFPFLVTPLATWLVLAIVGIAFRLQRVPES